MRIEDLKVLICDDSLLARKSLTDSLKNAGCKDIIEVYDGQAAIESYKANRPNVVFLDIIMPVKDGVTATREICEFDPDAHVIIVSSVGTQVHLREAIKAGAKDFLQKPASTSQIRNALLNMKGVTEE